jgi:hypothetical protein
MRTTDSMQSSTSKAIFRTCLTKVLTISSLARSLETLRKECIILNSSKTSIRSLCIFFFSVFSSSFAKFVAVSVPSTADLANPSTRSAIASCSLGLFSKPYFLCAGMEAIACKCFLSCYYCNELLEVCKFKWSGHHNL